jgi:hypothetical protein
VENTYYIRIRGRVQGPFDSQTLQTMARRGRFARLHEVSQDGLEWFRASEFPELFPERAKRKDRSRASESTNEETSSFVAEDERTESPEPEEQTTHLIPLAESRLVGNEESVWYYAVGDREFGPITLSQIRSLLGSGAISPETYVRSRDLQDWTPAHNVPQLSSAGSIIPVHDSASELSFEEPHTIQSANSNVAVPATSKFCHSCSSVLDQRAEICTHCGVRQPILDIDPVASKSGRSAPDKAVAFLLAWFLGLLGVHKFYLGHTGVGVFYLLMNVFLCWTIIVPVVFAIICFVEGILYLSCSDKEFERKFVAS